MFNGCFLEAFLSCTDTVTASARPVGAEKTIANGTDKSVPYEVQTKFCTNIAQFPGSRNVMVYANVSLPGYRKKHIGEALKRN